MAHFHRPNIVIFDETEVNYNNAPGQGLIVLVMPQSPHAHIDISHVQIQSALKQQTDHAFSMLTYASRSTIPMMAQIGAVTGGGFVLNIWPIWINVNPAEPGDIQTLQANERPNQRLRYTIYPQQNGDEGAGPSGEGGALGAGHQQPAPVDSSSDGLNQTLEDLGTGSTEVPETASPEITSSHLNIEG
ncbi:unnamed protein product [Urochloa decumbens]|uniref:Uncharacterized protein n=1 Tax=Urochloa decumbens TaxID=240449 RepID=A0ABC9B5F8_9POAL